MSWDHETRVELARINDNGGKWLVFHSHRYNPEELQRLFDKGKVSTVALNIVGGIMGSLEHWNDRKELYIQIHNPGWHEGWEVAAAYQDLGISYLRYPTSREYF